MHRFLATMVDSTVLISAVVLIIAIVVGYLFLNKDDKKAVTSSSSADSSDDIAVPDTEKMLPYMRTRAGPRDPDWSKRLKEELTVLMKVILCVIV